MSAGLFYLRSPWVFGPGFRKPLPPSLPFVSAWFLCAPEIVFSPQNEKESFPLEQFDSA